VGVTPPEFCRSGPPQTDPELRLWREPIGFAGKGYYVSVDRFREAICSRGRRLPKRATELSSARPGAQGSYGLAAVPVLLLELRRNTGPSSYRDRSAAARSTDRRRALSERLDAKAARPNL